MVGVLGRFGLRPAPVTTTALTVPASMKARGDWNADERHVQMAAHDVVHDSRRALVGDVP